uniref:BRI1-KD interacting protein 130 n=1 Tax=Leersia perrieri TaxID=77586 RepID=A0A0D9WC06_9ORYZ
MDGHSCGDLGRVSDVISDGTADGGIKSLPEKHCSSADGASREADAAAANADSFSEAGTGMDFSNSASFGVRKGFQKCMTFPPSGGEARQQGSCCDTDKDPKDAPTYERSVSLPPTLKIVSAMKGSREKNGMASRTESHHVKWAPDVYDPPVTSVCHSVNNSYKRQSKSRKKDKNKQKQKQKQKGRSKKNRQNAIQSSTALQAPGLEDAEASSSQSSAPEDLNKHETDILDYGISSQEAKCGSSFLRETVAKMHFSTAEAS